jgi:hypothetical protein
MKSEMVPLNEYNTFDEAGQAARGMTPKKLTKKLKLRKNDALVGIRIEVFIKTGWGDRRVKVHTLNLAPEGWV